MFSQSPPQRRGPAVRRLAAAVASAVLILGAASCGDGSGSPTATPSGTPSEQPDTAAAMVKFNACLRANGVKVSDSGPSVARGGDAEDPNFAAAAAKCKHHLAGTSIEVATGGGGQVSEDQLKAMLAYARCMRSEGINMPDPDPESGALAPKGGSDFDEESPEFQAAHSACRSHLGDAEAADGGGS